MNAEKTKQKLIEIFGDQIKFNKEFDKIFENLKKNMQSEFILWCTRCYENKELGSVPPKKEFRHLYVFFRKIGSGIRVVLIKEQNSHFISLILNNHKAYDDERIKLGYKKSSYYGS
ncbi:hypothetical protein HOD20_03590 [archaeon]|jgi:hypothetical protein|nr:hypothetical protein [archaeon]MBT4351584.1 hypothetical protein [archaeon]MBT4648341.1 hypothetical protein [archaeon]MBT6822330.1 hypothetical protein [archaeon]MBT7392809.1 hypothetical protein [archaeon]